MQEGQYDQLLKDVDRIKKCSLIAKQEINKSLDSVIELLTETKQQINEPMEIEDQEVRNTKIKKSLHNLHDKLREKKPLKSIIDSHKKYFQYLSKYGKNIEKIFKSDINNVFKDTVVTFEKEMVNEAIAQHLLIEKKFELYETFMQDTGLTHKIDQEKLNSLKLIQKVGFLQQFFNFSVCKNEKMIVVNQQLHEAIYWAESKKKELIEMDSPLLFYLHKLQFMQHLLKGPMDGIVYARQNLTQFFKEYIKYAEQAQKVMLYAVYPSQRVQQICEQNQLYQQIEELLIDNFCKLYNLTMKSALLQCLIAGTLALPKFLKYTQISSMDEEFRDYHTKNEYPIEVEIGKDFKYHSIFVCPISRDVIEPDQNPVLLICGHVISEASMKKITSSANKEKFKCPTCPKEMTAKDTRKIYF